MNKSNFFSGQPIFAQLLKFIPKDSIARIARDSKADHYSKRFNTYEHLVTMLYSIFNNCNSLREITTGMLASEQRLAHLGVRYHPRRSTISDANIRRQAEVFEKIYFSIFKSMLLFYRTAELKAGLQNCIFWIQLLSACFMKYCVQEGQILQVVNAKVE
jgi:hypothetical protein